MQNLIKPVLFLFLIIIFIAVYYRLRLAIAGLRVTSWIRSPEKNKRVGGVPTSKHILGYGFDVSPDTIANVAKLKKIGFKKVLREGDHIHVEIV